jgi:hypothetical protein
MAISLRRNHAGRSAARRYKLLSRRWRRRVLGRWTGFFVWPLFLLLALGLQRVDLSKQLTLIAGSLLGSACAAWLLLPDSLMPNWIGNWQRGASGEELTAQELRRLEKAGWTVRHDAATATGRANRDHIVAGPSLFLLDTKNFSDSEITVEGKSLRLTRIDDPNEGYLFDRLAVAKQSYWLEREIEDALGFPVAVNPVIVVWGRFPEQQAWLGNVAVVHGERIAQWIEGRPADILKPKARQAVADWVKQQPRASI